MAFATACGDAVCAGAPIYAPEQFPGELRAAISSTFTDEVRYIDAARLEEMTTSQGSFADAGTYIDVEQARQLTADTVGIDVWVARGFNNGLGSSYLFRWTGTDWVRATAEEVGVTVTTAVP